jgi:hypothetical protein
MNEDSDIEDLRQQFKIVCRKCGSEDVAINKDDSIDYGGEAGYQVGSVQIGCNGCKANDWCVWI